MMYVMKKITEEDLNRTLELHRKWLEGKSDGVCADLSDTDLRYTNLYRYTPEERYEQLLEKYRDIIQLIPLKEIASYLKITPIHLSRLRRKQKVKYNYAKNRKQKNKDI